MKTAVILALAGLLTATAAPAFAQNGFVLPSAPRNALERQLNDRIEMQTRADEARGITNSRAIQEREVRRDRRDRRDRDARRWDRDDRRGRDAGRWDRDDRRGEDRRRGRGWDGW
ncbi:hypothetical protein [Aureimonas sp. AU12]|uniref:hypothetical protein n=1 Tax=Aureimonas sp. AU12 TaxID=1638161 RepID=UPI000783D70D|nr:hypothetical protein [Aureimonas sp. AU12]